MLLKKTVLTVAIAATIGGCTMTNEQKTILGAVGGAVAGGVLGHQLHHKNGRYVGAVLGALAGGAITHYMNNQQQALEKALASSGITVTRIDNATIKLNLPSAITFAVNQSNLNPNVVGSLNAIAGVVNRYEKTALHVLGFTDSSGSNSFNMQLSQQRAQSTANYLASQGVVSGRMVVRGYGASHPIASNANAQGKAQNRRAEIYIKAIESGREQAAYNPIY